MEFKAWTIHYFARRREFFTTYCILKRSRDGQLIWDPQSINYNGAMDKVLENVVAFAKNYDGTMPIIYSGYHEDKNVDLFDWDAYQDSLKRVDCDVATLTELFLEIFDEQSARPRISN